MAVGSALPKAPSAGMSHAAIATVDIEAWTVHALQSLDIASAATFTGHDLSIPLDEAHGRPPALAAAVAARKAAYIEKKAVNQRDSMKRRNELLRGKEGSRRRQRWENDHLLHVPGVQPPLPSDWEVHPTYPIHHVPYYLAPLWENGVRHRAEEAALARKAKGQKGNNDGSKDTKGRVPVELRQKLKKSKGAKTLLQDLEEEVRKFVREYEGKRTSRPSSSGKSSESSSASIIGRERGDSVISVQSDGFIEVGKELGAETDSEDDEIVFVGRDATMSDADRKLVQKVVEEELEREKLVFDALEGDKGASFGRWLVHSIADYYGLTSRSVTVGNPARREAYVGIREMKTGGQIPASIVSELPRPLWAIV